MSLIGRSLCPPHSHPWVHVRRRGSNLYKVGQLLLKLFRRWMLLRSSCRLSWKLLRSWKSRDWLRERRALKMSRNVNRASCFASMMKPFPWINYRILPIHSTPCCIAMPCSFIHFRVLPAIGFNMEIFTPEAARSLMSSLIPQLSRPPYSQSSLDQVGHHGLCDSAVFEITCFNPCAAWLPVQGAGEGGWPAREEQPLCSQSVAG